MPSPSISTRVHAQIASTVSSALGLPAARVQTLSVKEIFAWCQQHGFEVDITVEKPAASIADEVAFTAELKLAA